MIRIENKIELSGKELADEFWEQDCSQQAEFLIRMVFKWITGISEVE